MAALDGLEVERELPNKNEEVEEEKEGPAVVLDGIEENGGNGVVAVDDKATLPDEVVVALNNEVEGEDEVELAAPNKGEVWNNGAVATEEEEDGNPKEGKGVEAVDDPNPK